MDRAEIETRVGEVIATHLGVEAAMVTPEAKLVDDLGADSLDTVELVMALEEALNIEITDDEGEKVVTVGDAYDLVERLVSGK